LRARKGPKSCLEYRCKKETKGSNRGGDSESPRTVGKLRKKKKKKRERKKKKKRKSARPREKK